MDDEAAHSVELTIPCASCGSIELLAHTMMCASCVKERIVLARIPETMQYMQCQGCSHIETPRQGWQAMEEETLWSHLIETHLELDADVTNPVIGWEVTPLDNRNHRINITISAQFGPFPLETIVRTLARSSMGSCDACSRKSGNYFEATVQIRSTGRVLEEEDIDSMMSHLRDMVSKKDRDPMWFITKEGEVKGGYDIVVGSKTLARQYVMKLIAEYGGTSRESHTIVGRREGEDVTRATIVYRHPGMSAGDVLEDGDQRLWRINRMTQKGAEMLAVDRHQRRGMVWNELERAVVVAQQRTIKRVDVLRRDEGAIDFLDPHRWEVVTIAKPWDDDGGENVAVVLIDVEWIALPEVNVHANLR